MSVTRHGKAKQFKHNFMCSISCCLCATNCSIVTQVLHSVMVSVCFIGFQTAAVQAAAAALPLQLKKHIGRCNGKVYTDNTVALATKKSLAESAAFSKHV